MRVLDLDLGLRPFFEPDGPTVQRLTVELIGALAARGELPTEAQVRERRQIRDARLEPLAEQVPSNPFIADGVPLPPLLPQSIRGEEPRVVETSTVSSPPVQVLTAAPAGVLVWRKNLPRTDALQVPSGSNHVGGVRLTQAKFENPSGHRIDQTTYFRNLFREFQWEAEIGRTL
jgi:hypothetical protein